MYKNIIFNRLFLTNYNLHLQMIITQLKKGQSNLMGKYCWHFPLIDGKCVHLQMRKLKVENDQKWSWKSFHLPLVIIDRCHFGHLSLCIKSMAHSVIICILCLSVLQLSGHIVTARNATKVYGSCQNALAIFTINNMSDNGAIFCQC